MDNKRFESLLSTIRDVPALPDVVVKVMRIVARKYEYRDGGAFSPADGDGDWFSSGVCRICWMLKSASPVVQSGSCSASK